MSHFLESFTSEEKYFCLHVTILSPHYKTTAISRIAVRETGIYQYHGAQLRAILKPLEPSENYRNEGFKGVL